MGLEISGSNIPLASKGRVGIRLQGYGNGVPERECKDAGVVVDASLQDLQKMSGEGRGGHSD